jgi:Golgi phosphoprotein 3 (GPP34)
MIGVPSGVSTASHVRGVLTAAGGMVSVSGEHVATRLVRLCLHRNGTLLRSPLLASSVRAALLADLALHGALIVSASELEVDTSPTGFKPADNLLAAVAAQPDQKLEWWLRRGTDAVRDTVSELLASGLWTRRLTRISRRYEDNDPASVKADAKLVRTVLAGGAAADNPRAAVLAVLVGVIGTDEQPGGEQPTLAELARCGAAQWLMGDLTDYLLVRRKVLIAAASEARISLSANFIQ